MDINILFSWVASCSVIFPLVLGLIAIKGLSREMKVLVYYIIAATLVQIAGMILALQNANNFPVFHLYTPIRFVLLSLVFFHLIRRRLYRKVLLVNCVWVVGFCIANAIWLQDIFRFNTYSLGVESLIMIGYAILLMYKIIRDLEVKIVESDHRFWLGAGVLFYYAGNLFIFTLTNNLLDIDIMVHREFWNIHSFGLIVFYSTLFMAIWVNHRKLGNGQDNRYSISPSQSFGQKKLNTEQ